MIAGGHIGIVEGEAGEASDDREREFLVAGETESGVRAFRLTAQTLFAGEDVKEDAPAGFGCLALSKGGRAAVQFLCTAADRGGDVTAHARISV